MDFGNVIRIINDIRSDVETYKRYDNGAGTVKIGYRLIGNLNGNNVNSNVFMSDSIRTLVDNISIIFNIMDSYENVEYKTNSFLDLAVNIDTKIENINKSIYDIKDTINDRNTLPDRGTMELNKNEYYHYLDMVSNITNSHVSHTLRELARKYQNKGNILRNFRMKLSELAKRELLKYDKQGKSEAELQRLREVFRNDISVIISRLDNVLMKSGLDEVLFNGFNYLRNSLCR